MSYLHYGVGAGGYAANYGYDDQRSANPTQAEARNDQGGGEPAHEEGAKGGPCAQRQHQHQKGTNDANKLRDGYHRSRSVSTGELPLSGPAPAPAPAPVVSSANGSYSHPAVGYQPAPFVPFSHCGRLVAPTDQGLLADFGGSCAGWQLGTGAYVPTRRSASAREGGNVEGYFGSLARGAATASLSQFKDMDKTLLAGRMGLVLGLGLLGGLTSSIGNLFGGALAASGVFGNPWMNCYSPYCCPPPFVSPFPFLFPLP